MILNNILKRYMCRLSNLGQIDAIQKASLQETCILVNENDVAIGKASKLDCHLKGAYGELLLHRAFSVYLFNTKGELLIQKRSPTKVTFPNQYSNSCCSHPLYDFQEELQEKNALGVKIAAKRRVSHELGVPEDQISPNDFIYLTRVLYNVEDYYWGEHELAYILVLHKDVTIKPNPNEISELCYVSKDNFSNYINNLKGPLTPWFHLHIQNKLNFWWDNLDNLEKIQDHVNIHKLIPK